MSVAMLRSRGFRERHVRVGGFQDVSVLLGDPAVEGDGIGRGTLLAATSSQYEHPMNMGFSGGINGEYDELQVTALKPFWFWRLFKLAV